MAPRTKRHTAVKKARLSWQRMSPRQRALAQLQGRARGKPGSTGEGKYYHIEVRPKDEFVTFRTHDVGQRGGIQRVGGKRRSGSWDDQKWLIGKEEAHLEGKRLVPDTPEAKNVLEKLGSSPAHLGGDRFRAKPRVNVPEDMKPTSAQRRARMTNVRKAQLARHR